MEGNMEIRTTTEAAAAARDLAVMMKTLAALHDLAVGVRVAGNMHANWSGLDEGLAMAVADIEDRVADLNEALAAWTAAGRLQ
jgi:hypothetical protein